MNSPTKNRRARVIEKAICPLVSFSSSSAAWFAEIVRALTPIDRACPRAMTPRNPGHRRMR
jgi:hypothetical protein